MCVCHTQQNKNTQKIKNQWNSLSNRVELFSKKFKSNKNPKINSKVYTLSWKGKKTKTFVRDPNNQIPTV